MSAPGMLWVHWTPPFPERSTPTQELLSGPRLTVAAAKIQLLAAPDPGERERSKSERVRSVYVDFNTDAS